MKTLGIMTHDGVYTNLGLLLSDQCVHLELIEAYGTGMLKIMGAYAGTGKEPKIETSDNAFKIILPNLNVQQPNVTPTENSMAEDAVIALTKEQGAFTRKDMEKALGMSQTTCGRLLKQMIGKGQIVKEGRSRNTYYRLAE